MSSSSEQDYSDVEETTWERFKISFGAKYKGRYLRDMIKTRKRREWLRYMLDWDKLCDTARRYFECALSHYAEQKAKARPPLTKPEKKVLSNA